MDKVGLKRTKVETDKVGYAIAAYKPKAESRIIKKKKEKYVTIDTDDYYLASMFPSDDVMHKVYSIIRQQQEA